MNESTQTDVLIVGAGPTGLALGGQLSRYGIAFEIVEKREGVTDFSKALGVHARTLEIYEQMGLASKAVEQGQVAGTVRLLEHGRELGHVDLRNVGEGMSPYPYMLVLEQSRNERLLYDYLLREGHDVSWQTELADFLQTEDSVTARIRSSDGTERTIEAKYLVGCDGPKSLVRHGLGLKFEGSTFERLFYVADVKIEWAFPHDALHVCLADHGVVAFFPMRGENRYRIVGAFPEGTTQSEGDVLFEEIEQRIKLEAGIALEISEVQWFSVYKVHSRHTESFSKGRCFLAGDAAHIHTPAGGQGMNTGIQDAYNLAWKLAFTLGGDAGPHVLDSYNQERLENAKRLLATTDRMFDLAAGSDWLLHAIRTTVFPPLAGALLRVAPVRRRFFSMISQTGIAYHESALSDSRHDAHFAIIAGDRMPYFLNDAGSIYDLLHAPKFHLLQFTHAPAGQEAAARLEGEFPGWIDCHILPLTPRVEEVFGLKTPFTVLLRPDNYIALIAPGTPPGSVRDYMNRLTGRV